MHFQKFELLLQAHSDCITFTTIIKYENRYQKKARGKF